jgi:cytochrome c oxidase subunit 2
MPIEASAFAFHYDLLFFAILALSLLFTVGTVAFVIYFSVKYARQNKVDRTHPIHEHMPLEITWTIIPTLLGLVIFAWSSKLFIDYRTPPKDATEIYVIGKQWMWHVQHAASGVRENNTVHLPLGRDIKFTMISQDVIHAFYIPEFRLQYQVLPGRYTQLWCRPTKVGTYRLFCAMYCGNQHSEMGGYVYVMRPEEYDKWIAAGGQDTQPKTLVERGADIFEKNACANCHGASDTMRAPSLYALYGKTRHFLGGGSAVADDAYIRSAILRPWDHVIEGYDQTMPQYQGQIQEEDIPSLVAYIKTLGQTGPAIAPKAVAQDAEKGSMPKSVVMSPRPKLAVGALDATEPKTPGLDQGHLAAGALGTSQSPKENR